MGGYSAPPVMAELNEGFVKAGGLQYCDLYSVHNYPGGAPESMQQDFDKLNALMDANGGRKPMWMTEFAYYADDDPDPITRGWPNLLESEYLQACYNTRACAIMLASGVEKVFYHIWPSTLNQDSGAVLFFEYGSEPRKVAATQAAMAWLLGPRPVFVDRVTLENDDVFGYVFKAPDYLQVKGKETCVAMVWSRFDRLPLSRLAQVEYYDIGGKKVEGKLQLSEAPMYLRMPMKGAEAVAGVRKVLEAAVR